MAEPETRPAPEEAAERPAEPSPQLSADFFRMLLDMPACKTKGVCDNCGRCEH